MKNTTIMKPLRFLEDHIDVILGLFFPAWFGIFFVLGLVLKLLPKEIAEKAGPQWMDTAFAILASLVVCAVIAILRMARNITGGTSRGPGPIIFLLATDILIMFFVFKMSAGMQAKVDTAYITSNLSLISKRLYAYQEEHGAYPPQQDIRSLLETLGIQESDFYRTYYFDIHSAEYHAPQGEIRTRDDWEEPILTIRVRQHVFGGNQLYIVRRDGSGYTKY